MSDLVEFEDLGLLDGGDLRAVFDQVSETQVLEALVGTRPAFRKQLLTKLPPASAARLEAQIDAHGPVAARGGPGPPSGPWSRPSAGSAGAGRSPSTTPRTWWPRRARRPGEGSLRDAAQRGRFARAERRSPSDGSRPDRRTTRSPEPGSTAARPGPTGADSGRGSRSPPRRGRRDRRRRSPPVAAPSGRPTRRADAPRAARAAGGSGPPASRWPWPSSAGSAWRSTRLRPRGTSGGPLRGRRPGQPLAQAHGLSAPRRRPRPDRRHRARRGPRRCSAS